MMILLALLFAMVQSPYNPPSYSCDGSTAVYTVPFPYVAYTDLVVTTTPAGGIVSTLAYTTDYTVNLTSTTSTATLTLTSPATKCPSGNILKIARVTALTQPSSFKAQTNYNQTLHEQAYDRTEMQVQERSYQETLDLSNLNTLLAALNSSGAGITSASTVLATGGTTALTLAAWFSQEVNVKAFGALGIGTDDAAFLQAAVTYACNNNKSVYIPGGTYGVSATVGACGNIKIRGDGDRTVLQPTISNSTPVLNFPPGSSFFRVSDIRISSTINTANFDLGTAAAQQCTGIRVQSTLGTGPFSSRFSLSNVHVIGVKIAYDIVGHILTADNLWAQYNEVGFKCSGDCNSFDLNLRLEDNRQDFAIDSGGGIFFRQLIMEGANTLGVPSTLDTVRGVSFSSPYFEASPTAPRTQPWLVVGGSTTVWDFKMLGATISSSSGFATGVYPVKLDNCVHCEIDAHFNEGAQLRKVLTTANTQDLKLSGVPEQGSYMQDSSQQVGTAYNYWPNSGFEMWLRGYDSVFNVRATISKETTTVRRGANALRVTATAGQNFNYGRFDITGPVVTALRNHTVRAGAWVFIPNIAEFNEAARTAYPAILLDTFDGADTSNNSINTGGARNEWNYIWVSKAVPAAATKIEIWFEANLSATLASGAEYIIVDDVSLVDVSVPVTQQMEGNYVDSVLIPATGIAGSMVSFGAAAPADVNQTYAKGDIVWNNAVVAAGSPGWICTTGGSPGTWKTMANVAP